MANLADAAQTYVVILETVTGVGIGYIYLRSKIPKQTISELQDLVDAQSRRIDSLQSGTKVCAEQHSEALKQISDLQGQIKTLKDVPLQAIAEHVKSDAIFQDKLLKIMADTSKTLDKLANNK